MEGRFFLILNMRCTIQKDQRKRKKFLIFFPTTRIRCHMFCGSQFSSCSHLNFHFIQHFEYFLLKIFLQVKKINWRVSQEIYLNFNGFLKFKVLSFRRNFLCESLNWSVELYVIHPVIQWNENEKIFLDM
jgi:hypothetical protein